MTNAIPYEIEFNTKLIIPWQNFNTKYLPINLSSLYFFFFLEGESLFVDVSIFSLLTIFDFLFFYKSKTHYLASMRNLQTFGLSYYTIIPYLNTYLLLAWNKHYILNFRSVVFFFFHFLWLKFDHHFEYLLYIES